MTAIAASQAMTAGRQEPAMVLNASSRPIRRIVLVHGAAHGAWCWARLMPILEARGYQVQAPDLPGLGDDRTPSAAVTFDDYVTRIVEVLGSSPEPALLLGHSLGGSSISQAAEQVPERVAKLVYLAAFLPEDGESAGGTGFKDMPQSAARAVRVGTVEGAHEFDPALAAEVFYHRCHPEVARWAVERLQPQANAPVSATVRLSAQRWGTIAKVYVLCAQDRALPPQFQQWLCDRAPGVRQRIMDSDHSPFLSDPQGLAALLHEEAQLP
jgi:pimeloyl-ACP methyl ester carboxylesterase